MDKRTIEPACQLVRDAEADIGESRDRCDVVRFVSQPGNWLQNQQKVELIAEIETNGISAVSRAAGRFGQHPCVRRLQQP